MGVNKRYKVEFTDAQVEAVLTCIEESLKRLTMDESHSKYLSNTTLMGTLQRARLALHSVKQP